MKTYFIINAHSTNRGDEAAVKGLIDSLIKDTPSCKIYLTIMGEIYYPNLPAQVEIVPLYPTRGAEKRKEQLSFMLSYYTAGKINLGKRGKDFIAKLKSADLIMHAPGGPSIGDTYAMSENRYLLLLNLVRKMGKPYMFYAPSMGPFKTDTHESLRKQVLMGASKIVVREPISKQYIEAFMPELSVEVTLDSAFQNPVDSHEETFNNYKELSDFYKKYERCVGVTITDLLWHPIHGQNAELKPKIKEAFTTIIDKLTGLGYGVIFIPQLYGPQNDYDYMAEFCVNDACFIMNNTEDKYDALFQQYVIGKLYAVIGMRYHSNIFSAKMSVPFISVSYEQKMQGFMESNGFVDYCIPIAQLSGQKLSNAFELLEQNYDEYKRDLTAKKDEFKERAYRTTEIALALVNGEQKNRNSKE